MQFMFLYTDHAL